VNSHKNARLAFAGRVCLVERVINEHWRVADAARGLGISKPTVRKWVKRWEEQGITGLADRSSRPHRSPRQIVKSLETQIKRLRLQRLSGPEIADRLALPISTVGDVLRRLDLGRLPPLFPPPPVVRYEKEHPGELIHIDTKRLGRIVVGFTGRRVSGRSKLVAPTSHAGWECLHVAIDDASRIAYAEILPDGTAKSAVVFLDHAVNWLKNLGISIDAVMTDNAFCFVRGRYPGALAKLSIKHVRIRPYTPRTNGKAERFIQTALREWAYKKHYTSSDQRTSDLELFLTKYNTKRPHCAHGRRPPISRLIGKQPVR
jgi:transposase InsO family protein/transposase-like protein